MVKRALLAGAILLGVAGCQTMDDPMVALGLEDSPEEKAAAAAWQAHVDAIDPAAEPAPYRPYLTRIKAGAREDAPLGYMELGTVALEQGDLARAGESFDQVNAVIESTIADSEQAERARSLWHAESEKLFKGEPYERAMSFYYRGLLDLMSGDYENARASFKSAQLQDFLAEESENAGDYWLFAALEGWASQCNGDSTLAADAYSAARRLKPDFPLPAAEDDLLIVVERDGGPKKGALGEYKELLKFFPGRTEPIERIVARAGDHRVEDFGAEDIYWQATTRGGRRFDVVLEGKAYYKGTAEHTSLIAEKVGVVAGTAGAAALASAAASGGDSDAGVALLGVALIALAVGGIADGISEAIATEADTRMWASLPGTVLVASAPRPEGTDRVLVRALDSRGYLMPAESRDAEIRGDERCGVAWTRTEWTSKSEPKVALRRTPYFEGQIFGPPVPEPLLALNREVRCAVPQIDEEMSSEEVSSEETAGAAAAGEGAAKRARIALGVGECLARDGLVHSVGRAGYAAATVPDREVLCETGAETAPRPASECVAEAGTIRDFRFDATERLAVQTVMLEETPAAAGGPPAPESLPRFEPADSFDGIDPATKVLCRHARGMGEMSAKICAQREEAEVVRVLE